MQLFGEEHATVLSSPYWEGLRERRLVLQHCRACDAWQHYPRYRCTACGSKDLEWSTSSGCGTVLAATTMDRSMRSDHAALLPMPLVLVGLDEQVFVLARVVGEASAGSRVRFDGEETVATGLLTLRAI